MAEGVEEIDNLPDSWYLYSNSQHKGLVDFSSTAVLGSLEVVG